MKITKKDLLLAAPVVLVLAVLIVMSTDREKARMVPADGKHRPFYEAIRKGVDRVEVERGCIACHNLQTNPLPRKHPPKEQCLICHKFRRS